MDIAYLGGGSFRIKGKASVVVTDPTDIKKAGANIITLSAKRDGGRAFYIEDEAKIIQGPGEYEIGGVSVVGVGTESNTVYVIEIDTLRLCHLGNLTQKLTDDQVKDIGTVDILFVPMEKSEVVSQLGPSIIIPMNYKDEEFKTEDFVSQLGIPSETLPKLSLKEIGPDEERVVCLTPVK